MSVQTRNWVVNHPRTKFRGNQQDVLDKLNTAAVGHIVWMLGTSSDIGILFTALVSDHDDDSALNPTPPHEGTHAAGCGMDTWPLDWSDPKNVGNAEAYAEPDSPIMDAYLERASSSPYIFQIGEAGTADTPHDIHVALGTHDPNADFVFNDSGADHVHFGTVYE